MTDYYPRSAERDTGFWVCPRHMLLVGHAIGYRSQEKASSPNAQTTLTGAFQQTHFGCLYLRSLCSHFPSPVNKTLRYFTLFYSRQQLIPNTERVFHPFQASNHSLQFRYADSHPPLFHSWLQTTPMIAWDLGLMRPAGYIICKEQEHDPIDHF